MSANLFVALTEQHESHDWLIKQVCLMQSMILIEIQDTMAQPPSEEKSMKKATHTGIFITVNAHS